MTGFGLNKSMFLDPRATPESAWLGHIPLAGWLIEAVRPRLLVELGTHRGASYFAFCQAVQENGLDTRCYAVDTWQGDEHAGAYGEDVFRSVSDHNREHYDGFSKLMRMTFEEACGYFENGTIDVLHIDGLHTYDAVRHDFETWLPRMSPRGVILFHDTNVRERDFGVWKLWSELRERYPAFEFSHTHGLGVLLVGAETPVSLQGLVRAAGEARADEVNRLFERLGQLIATRQRLDELIRRHIHVDGDNGHLRGVLADRDAAIAQLRSELAQLQESLREHQTRAAESAALLADARQVVGQREAALAETRQTLIERDAALDVANAAAIEAARAQGRLQAESAALVSRVTQLESELSQAAATIAAQTDEAGRLAGDLAAARASLSAILGSTTWRLASPVQKLVRLLCGDRLRTERGDADHQRK